MKRLAAWTLLGLLVSCNSLLDLDRAHLDPSITADSSGGSPGEAGASAAGGDAGAPAEPQSLCEQYCSAVTTGCTGDNTQYTDLGACLAECPYFAEGAEGDSAGNTLHCRLSYAIRAPSEPITYCTWAGPGGDGMCGSNCEGFCTLMTAACTPETTGPDDYFADNDACLAKCKTLPSVGRYDAVDPSITGGDDNYECRLYHVGAAISAADPGVHCPHAAGRSLCVNR